MRTSVLVFCIALAGACGGNSCDEYVDLLCDCVGTEAECDSLKQTFENADADVQAECSALMGDAREASQECMGTEDSGRVILPPDYDQ